MPISSGWISSVTMLCDDLGQGLVLVAGVGLTDDPPSVTTLTITVERCVMW